MLISHENRKRGLKLNDEKLLHAAVNGIYRKQISIKTKAYLQINEEVCSVAIPLEIVVKLFTNSFARSFLLCLDLCSS